MVDLATALPMLGWRQPFRCVEFNQCDCSSALIHLMQTVAFTLSACSDCLTNATVLFSFNVKRDVDPHQMLVTLVERLVDLLVADAVELQEAAREALGSSTAQAVPIVLDQMHE